MTIEDRIVEFTKKWPDSRWGPAHIVLEDFNLIDAHLEWCIGLARAAISGNENDLVSLDSVSTLDHCNWYSDHSSHELKATIDFLERLLMIPEGIRLTDEEDDW